MSHLIFNTVQKEIIHTVQKEIINTVQKEIINTVQKEIIRKTRDFTIVCEMFCRFVFHTFVTQLFWLSLQRQKNDKC